MINFIIYIIAWECSYEEDNIKHEKSDESKIDIIMIFL